MSGRASPESLANHLPIQAPQNCVCRQSARLHESPLHHQATYRDFYALRWRSVLSYRYSPCVRYNVRRTTGSVNLYLPNVAVDRHPGAGLDGDALRIPGSPSTGRSRRLRRCEGCRGPSYLPTLGWLFAASPIVLLKSRVPATSTRHIVPFTGSQYQFPYVFPFVEKIKPSTPGS